MADLLDMDYINSLPQPFLGRMLGGAEWPIYDIEVETGLIRIDVCGKLDVKDIGDFTAFRDDTGVWRSSEAFYADANEEERAPIAGVTTPSGVERMERALKDQEAHFERVYAADGVALPHGSQK